MDLKELIACEAEAIDRAMRYDLADMEPLDPLLNEVLEYGLFSGGKRVRPLLTVLCSRLCETEYPDEYRLAIAFEYLHAATLFHDDVIDRADIRRGRMSVVKRFGLVGAILAGDFLHARAMALVGRLGGAAALEVFADATLGMVDGEFIQLRHAGQTELSEEQYFAVVRGKTALLIGSACVIGGIAGGANRQQQEALRIYGVNLGSAFQIIDDILDYQGDQHNTGKVVGNDLVEGKITLPLILALQSAQRKDRERILAILSSDEQRQQELNGVIRFISTHHGFATARQRAESLVASGINALGMFRRPGNGETLQALESLAHYVLNRRR